MRTSESTIHIRTARIAAKRMMQKPRKDAVNPHFNSRYSSFEEIMRVVEAAFLQNDLDIDFEIVRDGDEIGARVIISHAPSGEFLEYEPVYMPVGKKTPQGYGSIITYIKRYAICAACAIAADSDDDANAVEGEIKKVSMRIPRKSNNSEESVAAVEQTCLNREDDAERKRKHKGFMAWCRKNDVDDILRLRIIRQHTGKESSTLLTIDEMRTVYNVLNGLKEATEGRCG